VLIQRGAELLEDAVEAADQDGAVADQSVAAGSARVPGRAGVLEGLNP
jgi:hypothetical protein